MPLGTASVHPPTPDSRHGTRREGCPWEAVVPLLGCCRGGVIKGWAASDRPKSSAVMMEVGSGGPTWRAVGRYPSRPPKHQSHSPRTHSLGCRLRHLVEPTKNEVSRGPVNRIPSPLRVV